MLLRLILALLVASFALPATAAMPACHDAADVGAMHHGAPAAPDRGLPPHVCIGCVPLADWDGVRIAAPAPVMALPPAARAERLDLGGMVAPALPPPRRG